MKGSELRAKLLEAGCSLSRSGSGHDLWKNKEGKIIVVPRRWSKEVPTGTAHKILKDAGIK